MPRINRTPSVSSASSGSSSESAESANFSDWASSLHGAYRTQSLFDETLLDSPKEAIEYDTRVHGFNLDDVLANLSLKDDYARIRLVNYIRKEKPQAQTMGETLDKTNPLFEDDKYLIPVVENDPLLQIGFDDSWSDDEEANATSSKIAKPTSKTGEASQLAAVNDGTATLGIRLKELIQALGEDDTANTSECSSSDDENVDVKGKGKPSAHKGSGAKVKKPKDNDSYYFDSYAANDIHELMLRDTTRTVSYGRFIMSNPAVFKDKLVMDVGCGTGILSMFAARAGAKHVYAIEASGFANKARQNIKNNGLEDVITVIQGKVEEIKLPVQHVDVIISEWMGYMLLYEAMLDSVLHARDRFLSPGGLMVPSQTRIILAGITGQQLWDEGFGFWDNVYGFDMSAMRPTRCQDGLIEIVKPEEICTSETIVKDINTHTATVKSLDFHSDFELFPKPSASGSAVQIRAFITWFDTFFSHDSSASGQASSSQECSTEFFSDDAYERSIASVNADKADVSFTTGPRGKPTHWKQVVFMLKQPVSLEQGQRIKGTFNCIKGHDNQREVDVEIHWKVVNDKEEDITQMNYDVFRVN
ncbi:hypothetical protein QFC22_000999 [Naganishia vaughanmartiniae]|uniref:Uncharacterized protein n=1 Tax=Naganishia vaughanmartiniae TaxID=1424756 RepID=A0ACC2XNC0_9TREE|nr:hypothetical protein QFC22_000999 [Naganishia vaughanmartiniae]